jgi:hypothetical protein
MYYRFGKRLLTQTTCLKRLVNFVLRALKGESRSLFPVGAPPEVVLMRQTGFSAGHNWLSRTVKLNYLTWEDDFDGEYHGEGRKFFRSGRLIP